MTGRDDAGIELPPVCQLGYVVSDLERICEYYTSTLGMGPFTIVDVDMDGAKLRGRRISTKIRVALARSGEVEVEFIQPIEGENIYTEFLAAKGDGIHHLAFRVEDMDAMLAEFARRGLHPVFQHDMKVMEFAYFDTSDYGGLMIELLHWKRKA